MEVTPAIVKTISVKNVRAWVSMVSYSKKKSVKKKTKS